MTSSTRVRVTPRRIRIRRIRATGVLLAIAATAAVLGHELASPSSPVSSIASSLSTATSPIDVIRREHGSGLGVADGSVPDRTTVFAQGIPGVANLDPALLGALRRAAIDAANDGVEIYVDSGWRSPAYQEELLRQAVRKYGSEEEAARWVATPTTSAHVSGEAVDLGRSDATAWLSAHGAGYGLCQIYGNEPWHYELRPAAVGQGCPLMYPDPTHDPRNQQ